MHSCRGIVSSNTALWQWDVGRKGADAAIAVGMRAFHDTTHARSRDANSASRECRPLQR